MNHAPEKVKTSANKYTPEEIDRGLAALALVNGNVRRAAKELKKAGLPIPFTTLDQWKRRTHPERYLEIQRETVPRLRAQLAEDNEALAGQLLDIARENASRLAEKVKDPNISFKERAQAGYHLALSEGIVVDKSLVLRGDPNNITEHRELPATLSGLERLGLMPKKVDNEAEYVDAEVVSSPDGLPSPHTDSD